MLKPKRGLVLGKFMPPHQGHRFLVDFASLCTQELAVVVGSLSNEPIPGELRYRWMQELFPDCRILHLDKDLPQYPHEAENFWDLWRESLLEILPWPVDRVFASEDYGPRLAQELGAEFLPLDLQRQNVPVSGTLIRDHPRQYWHYLPHCVRPYFAQRIAVLGPESCGKSTLVRELAWKYGGQAVPEYAEILLRHQQGQLVEANMPQIAQAQSALEEALARQSDNGLLFCDTDLLSTCLWWQELYGSPPHELEVQAQQQSYAWTLLCTPDLAWQDDLHRLCPDTRQRFFERCQRKLEEWQRPYTVISGQGKARLQQACTALEPIFTKA